MRVLVLEDDTGLVEAVRRFLVAGGYAVDVARTWGEADERAAVNDYDALVLDRSVPGGDSIDLLRTRRADGDHTPAIFLTARDAVADRVDGLEAGADDYLVKPFAMAELVARVHVLTRRSTAVAEPQLRLADLLVDPARRRVWRRQEDLGLTAKEFVLLRYLLAHTGRVVSRSELIEHCWDEIAEPMSNVVDVKIAQLRRKLGEPPLVHTVRGAGYLASAEAP